MKIVVGFDHGGFPLKQTVLDAVRAAGHESIDMGTDSAESVDFPDFTEKVGRREIRLLANHGPRHSGGRPDRRARPTVNPRGRARSHVIPGTQVPMLNANGNGHVRRRPLRGPSQGAGRRRILRLACANLFDDRARNDDCGSEPLEQIEPGDTSEQNEG